MISIGYIFLPCSVFLRAPSEAKVRRHESAEKKLKTEVQHQALRQLYVFLLQRKCMCAKKLKL